MHHVRRFPFTILTLVALSALSVPARPAAAQAVYYACYVPASGTVYRIRTTDTRQTCSSTSHVEFSWTNGTGADHGLLGGLSDDDHQQYLLTNGSRFSNGFAVTGTFASGWLAASGPGTRMLWHPLKAAFRAGHVDGTEWDEQNIGAYSTALGLRTTASGVHSTAIGVGATASGPQSTAIGSLAQATAGGALALGGYATAVASRALGSSSTASGQSAVALGVGSIASGNQSMALGPQSRATGAFSTAMGLASNTNGKSGSFIYSDATLEYGLTSTADNQFLVRASGGTVFLSTAGYPIAGVRLSPGSGAWEAVSDVNLKEHFRDIDAEEALRKVAAMPIREWNYRTQDSTIRHLGPTAQDFFAAFRLGASDTTITTIDADGVSLLAIQALERRTAELRTAQQALDARTRELEGVRGEVAALREELARLAAGVAGARRK